MPSGQLIYNPQIQVLIDTNGENGIIDVSQDIISFQLNRIVNGVSSFSCTLNNKNKKYTMKDETTVAPVIETLNRIVVNMTRTNTIQVFSGYVTLAPVIVMLPNAIQIEAKCTLKRLQNTFWDSGIPELRAILPGLLSKVNGGGNDFTDGGAAQGMANLLAEVVGWEPKQMYFGKIPDTFLNLAATEFKDNEKILNNNLLSNLRAAIDSLGVPGTGGSNNNDGSKNSNNNFTNPEWCQTVLAEAGLPTTQNNIENMTCWMWAECPHPKWWNPDGPQFKFNPLCSKQDADQSNSYPDLATAATCTAKLLKFPDKSEIYKVLKNDGSKSELHSALVNSNWVAPDSNGNKSSYNWPDYSSVTITAVPDQVGSFSETVNKVIAAAMNQIGIPYAWGGGSPTGPTRATDGSNTIGFDCSGLVQFAYAQAGITIPRTTNAQWANMDVMGPQYTSHNPLPGDLLYWDDNNGNPPGHVTMCLTAPDSAGKGQQIQAQQPNTNINKDIPYSLNSPDFIGFKRPWASSGGGTNSNGTSGQNSNNSSNGATTNNLGLFNTMFVLPQWNPVAQMTYGSPRGFVMDEPVLNSISQLATASFRHFQSLGTGEFMTWFPDYFGLYGTPAAWQIYNIEITDLTIYHNDEPLTTHVAVVGDNTSLGQNITSADWLQTLGIVSVQTANVMTLLFGEEVGKTFNAEDFMNKYGMRPYITTQPLVRTGVLEFSYSLMTFMNMWAQQYTTQVGFTFMPELFPGIRIEFPDIKIEGAPLECYVSSVTHEGDMTNGFITKATLTAPSAGGKMIYLGLS